MSNFDPNIHVPGIWRCAKCSFQLIQSNLNAQDGSVTARDDAGDRCPNDDAPLWRVTWKDYATEAWERAEEYFERARVAEAASTPPHDVRRDTRTFADGIEAAAKVARDYASKAKQRGWITNPESAKTAASHIADNIRALARPNTDGGEK